MFKFQPLLGKYAEHDAGIELPFGKSTDLGHDFVLMLDGQVIALKFVSMHNHISYTELEEHETKGETPHACFRVLWICEDVVELGDIPAANKGACMLW